MWTIDPKIPMTLWWVLVAAALTSVGWYGWRADRSWTRRRRWWLTALLGGGLVGPLLILLNPTWIEAVPPVAGRPRLTVLVDGTMSMATQDVTSDDGTTSRWQRASEIARTIQAGRSSVDVHKLAFGEQVKPFNDGDTEVPVADASAETWPQGSRSDLALAMRQTVRTGSPAGHAIVLISDGAHNTGSVHSLQQSASEANALATPIYTITLGSSVRTRNLSVNARSARIIAFPRQPIVLRATLGHNGLAAQSTDVMLMKEDTVLQKKTVPLTAQPTQEVVFQLPSSTEGPLERFRIVASDVPGEVTTADNQTTILVQQLNAPIGVLVLEGKPYWDSKFLARNLARDPVVDLTTIIRLGPGRFLQRKVALDPASGLSPAVEPTTSTVDEKISNWTIQREFASPLDSPQTLEQFRVVMLGRDAGEFLTEAGIANLRNWISQSGGCLLCSRGAPADQITAKLAEILPVRWTPAAETHFRAKVSQRGIDSSIFDPLLAEGIDPLGTLPSLAAGATPAPRPGVPQVLIVSNSESEGAELPIVTHQTFGNGETIVVEGAGMWRWAFLPPQHADKDKIYPTLWQSMIQWIISQQDVMPGQAVAIRADRATFLSGDRASASVILRDPQRWQSSGGGESLSVMLQSADMELPKRLSLAASGIENGLFKVDLGTLNVGYYNLKVVAGDKDEVIAATAFEVRDPWFESLEVDARPDLLRQVAKLSGGQVLSPEDAAGIVARFEKELQTRQRHEEIRTSMWDRPWVLVAILGGWMSNWFVRRRSGTV